MKSYKAHKSHESTKGVHGAVTREEKKTNKRGTNQTKNSEKHGHAACTP